MEEVSILDNAETKLKKRKKRNKKTAIVITERDINILRFLSSGCATFEQILHALKTIYKMPGSGPALKKRLCLLRQSGYIMSRRYPAEKHKRYVLYSLAKPGVDRLVMHGYAIERIRWGLPDPAYAVHEMAVTEIVRAIRRESARHLYDFSIFDEVALKTIAPSAKVFPDLLVKLVFNVGGKEIEKRIAIEYDNGTEYAVNLVNKIKRLIDKYPVIILSRTSERIDTLKKVFSKISNTTKDENLKLKVFFALLEEFYRSGFLNTTFTNCENKKGKIL